ncbi:hypothetical protein CRM22_007240 [Opisthorchis felineus]|uniref:adenylate cyclase n=1 Tax=Opisthorchis felineus TaxID=147828 RepID=A0A4S2LGQ9_OPIFE|nr:hypothetical protein CRM22_007240 [Opisthorchis felineus]
MQRHLGWLARSRVYHFSLRRNLVQPTESYTLVDKLGQIYRDISCILSFHSKVYENYFNAASIQYTRRCFRSALVFAFFTYWGCVFAMAYNTGAFEEHNVKLFLVLMVAALLLYLFSYNKYSHQWYSRTSCAVLAVAFSISMIGSMEVIAKWMSIIPYLEMLFSLCIILPLTLDFTLSLIVSFSFAYMNAAEHQISFTTCGNETYSSRTKLPDVHLHTLSSYCDSRHGVTIEFGVCILIFIAGMYLQFWNTIRRRAAFIYIGQAVHLQRRNRKVLATSENLRDVLMPSFIWHKYEGKENLRQTYANRRLYLQPAVDVTILVTELVNFRELISTQDIQTVVLIMSDMIDYFDRKSNEHDCERLAVLPDTYVYTCGVVKSRMNHARCCVELARAMVHVNEHLTLERSHLVLLRVGVHTGKATIMVWGGRKVHYDLISPDVFIAFHVKDSGPPGYITISDETHTRVHMNFPTELGERLILQTECLVDGKFTVRSKALQTYYVTQEPTKMESSSTSSIKSEPGLFERCMQLMGQIRASKSRKPTLLNQDFATEAFAAATTVGRRSVFSISPKELVIPSTSIHCSGETSRWNKDRTEEPDSSKPYQLDAEVLRLITQLRADPKRQITLMQYIPVGTWSNVFTNRELEWHYINHVQDPKNPIYVDSLKLAPAMDSIMILVTTVILLVCSVIFTENKKTDRRIFILYALEAFVAFLLCVCVCWTSTRFVQSVTTGAGRRLFVIMSKNSTRQFFVFVLTILPSIHSFILFSLFEGDVAGELRSNNALIVFNTISSLNIMVATTTSKWIGVLSLFICHFAYLYVYGAILDPKRFSTSTWSSISSLLRAQDLMSDQLIRICTSLVVVLTMINLNERNCRLNFIAMRELQISREESEIYHTKLREMMDHLLPGYVTRQLLRSRSGISNSSVKHHNAEWENVGVAVLYMSNLYITHWNLESEQLELSLKVLNLFVCTIDDMISSGRFSELEKVRFFNDMIVLASGLNQFKSWDCSDTTHMDILVEFCVQAQRRMQRINSEHLPKKRLIDLKIGYTRGQVTTAVIGLQKPTFIVWGRSLEVAENVARNAFAHEVQTVFECTLILSAQYEAILAGVIPVENEGLLDTYIVRPHR